MYGQHPFGQPVYDQPPYGQPMHTQMATHSNTVVIPSRTVNSLLNTGVKMMQVAANLRGSRGRGRRRKPYAQDSRLVAEPESDLVRAEDRVRKGRERDKGRYNCPRPSRRGYEDTEDDYISDPDDSMTPDQVKGYFGTAMSSSCGSTGPVATNPVITLGHLPISTVAGIPLAVAAHHPLTVARYASTIASPAPVAASGSGTVAGPSGTVASPTPMDTDPFPARVNQTPITPENFVDFASMTQSLILGSPFAVADTNQFSFGVEQLLAEQLATSVGNVNIEAFNDGTENAAPVVTRICKCRATAAAARTEVV